MKKKTPAEKLKTSSAYGKKRRSVPQPRIPTLVLVAWDCKECGTTVDPLRGHDADSCQRAKDYSKVGHCPSCAGRRSQDMCTCSCVTCHPEFVEGHPHFVAPAETNWHERHAASSQGTQENPFRKRSILERLGEQPFLEFLAATTTNEYGKTTSAELTHGLEKLTDFELAIFSKAIQSVKETWEMEACRKLRRQIDEARSVEKVSEEAFRSRQDDTTLKFVEGLELRNVELEESLLFLTLKVLRAQKKKEESNSSQVMPAHWDPQKWELYRSGIEMQERYRIGAAIKAHACSSERPAEGSSEALIHVAQMIEKNELK